MSSKYADAIIKLNQLTKSGDIEWSTNRFEPDSISGTERLIGNSFVTEVNKRLFRIYKYEERHYSDYEDFVYVPTFRLEFIDDKGRGGWQFPYDRSIQDLYDSILYKISGTDDFIDGFLKA